MCTVNIFSGAFQDWNYFRMKFKSEQLFILGTLLCALVGTGNFIESICRSTSELINLKHAKSIKKLSCSPQKFT